MMKHKLLPIFSTITFAFCLLGCSNNQVGFSGKVAFSDTGEPVPLGEIQFTTPTFVARSVIQKDGTFKTGSYKAADGLPPGTYDVAIVSRTIDAEDSLAPPTYLIDPKYGNSKTSGLSVTIESTTRSYEFKVDRPPIRNRK